MSAPPQGLGGGGGGLSPTTFLGTYSGTNPSSPPNGYWWYRVDTGQIWMNVNGTIMPVQGTGSVTVISTNTTIANTDVFNDIIVTNNATLTIYGAVTFHGNVIVENGATLLSSNPSASSSSPATNTYSFLGNLYLNGTYSIAQYNTDVINNSTTISTIASAGGASPTISGAGTLSIASGVTLTTNANTTWSVGNVSGSGALYVPSGYTLTIGANTAWSIANVLGPGALSIPSGYTLTVNGNAMWPISTISGAGSLSVASGYALTVWEGNTLSASSVSGEIRLVTLVNVINNQSQSTPAGLQVPISTTLTYPSGTWFWNPTDGWLYAWLESLSSSNQANIWVKIPRSIPAYGTYQIYMVQDNTKTFDGTYWGEAPNLSSSYAQYDNGANVFSNYWNFAGASAPSGINVYSSSGSVTFNNGVTIKGGTSATGGENGIATSASFSPPVIVDYYGTQSTSPSGDSWGWNMVGFSNYLSSSNGAPFAGGTYTLINFEGDINGKPVTAQGGTVINGTLPTPSNNLFPASVWTHVYTQTAYYTYQNYTNNTGYITGANNGASLPFEIMVGNNEASYCSSGMTVNWLRVRYYPPNGVMPSVQFTYSQPSTAVNIPAVP